MPGVSPRWLQNAPSSGSVGVLFGTVRIVVVSLAMGLRYAESIKLHSALCGGHSTGGPVRRPVPGLAAGWLRLLSIARLSGPSITNYTSIRYVQVLNCTIYEMASNPTRIECRTWKRCCSGPRRSWPPQPQGREAETALRRPKKPTPVGNALDMPTSVRSLFARETVEPSLRRKSK